MIWFWFYAIPAFAGLVWRWWYDADFPRYRSNTDVVAIAFWPITLVVISVVSLSAFGDAARDAIRERHATIHTARPREEESAPSARDLND